MAVILLGADSSTPPPDGGNGGGGVRPVVVPSYSDMVLSSNRGSVFLQGDVEAVEEWEGFGPVGRKPLRSRALGRGGTIRNRRRPYTRGEREIIGPLHIAGRNAVERSLLMDKVIDICSPLDGSPVTMTMNRRGESVFCSGDALFSGNAEFSAGAAYDKVAVVQFSMSCPDPLFYAVAPRTASQVDPAGAPFFPIGPVILSDSTGFGTPLKLDVGGSWKTYPEIVARGPMTELVITWSDGSTFGLDLASNPLLGGQRIVIRTDPQSAFDGALRVQGPGAVSYWRYTTSKALRPLLPGRETVNFDVIGQSSASEITVTWRPSFQAVS